MKKQSILNLNISSINDITKIEESCKYIDLDLTNYSSEVINYFLKNGSNYMYSEIIAFTNEITIEAFYAK